MAKQTREIYRTGDPIIDMALAKISERLDIIEGLRPDLDEGVYYLSDGKLVSTTDEDSFHEWSGSSSSLNALEGRAALGLGTMATQDADGVDISGGCIQIMDANEETIHKIPVSFLAQTSDWFNFI